MGKEVATASPCFHSHPASGGSIGVNTKTVYKEAEGYRTYQASGFMVGGMWALRGKGEPFPGCGTTQQMKTHTRILVWRRAGRGQPCVGSLVAT